jgi:hypothetical protein
MCWLARMKSSADRLMVLPFLFLTISGTRSMTVLNAQTRA